MLTTLIILTWNEIEGITALMDKIPFHSVDDTIIVDGGSTDGTIEYLKGRGYKVIRQKKPGRGNAFIEGVSEAHSDQIVFFSPDGNEDPNDISKLISKLSEGYDMVIASRFMSGGKTDDSDDPFHIRKYANRLFTKLLNITFKESLTDSLNGFRIIRKSVFQDLNIDAQNFEIEYQMSIRALKKGYKVAEIPTIESKRIGGRPKVKTRRGYRYISVFLKEALRII